MTRPLVAALAALTLLVLPAAASASVTVNVKVDHGDDGCAAPPGDCTLREAINTPPSDGLIIVPPGTYTVDSELDVDEIMEIRGAGARSTTIQHASGIDRVMLVEAALASVTISGVRITGGNDRENTGGGISVDSGTTLHLYDSAVEDNTGTSGGGIWSAGTLDIRRTTIARNHAVGDAGEAFGGGIHVVTGGAATLENTTVSRNTARDGASAGHGGGIYTAANLDLRNVTITENEAGMGVRGDGGGLFQEFAGGPLRTVAHNIVIARNLGLNCWGTVNDQVEATNSVSDEAAIPGGPSCNSSVPTNQLVADARLGPLANNGGSTDTHALLTGSPGIDKGGAPCPATDQRGISRPRGAACDAGAYELVPAPPPPPNEPLPPPKPGKTVNALTKSGTVKIKLPGASTFVVLGEGRQIPVNTVVDTRKGRVTLVAAANKTGGTAKAVFYDGLFKLTQSKGARPITTLTLVEKLTGCKANGKASAAKKKVKKRRLWGDGKGRFRTKGKHSAATVVGTKWLVEDRCTSTLTKVARGKVSVRDFVKRRTVIVKAGKKYVARRR